MSAWTAFGFGVLLGAAVFDFAWRRLWKLSEQLRAEIAASADTHPKDGDSTEIEAPLVSGAVPKADAHD